MFHSIWEDIRTAFRTGNMVTRLVIINFSVFAAVNVLKFLLFLFNAGQVPSFFDDGLYLFCMPADFRTLLWHPWAPFTHIFLHEGFFHVLNNIIFLYLFGTIVGDLIGDRRVLPIYVLGGLVGGFLFSVSAFFIPYLQSTYALGASGAVMALAGAAVTLAPDYRVMLILLGEVRLKYIVLVMVLLDMIGIANVDNTGGHVAHIGGFVTGILLIHRLREGQDIMEPINAFFERVQRVLSGKTTRKQARRQPEMSYRRPNSAAKPDHKTDNNDLSFQEKLDAILDKIRESGYDNLSKEEKEFLFDASKR